MPNDTTLARVASLESAIVALQAAIEHLLTTERTFRYALGGLLQEVFHFTAGQSPRNEWARYVHKDLYPTPTGIAGVSSATPAPWRSPARLWKAYGNKARVTALAVEHGVKVRKRESATITAKRLLDVGVRPDGVKGGA